MILPRLLGYVLIGTAVVLVATVVYRNSGKGDTPLIFSPVQMLEATWLTYTNTYVEVGTYRTIDTGRGDVTTSEGQSYTMLRAVWLNDKTTFDGAWKWTQTNIYHTSDHLFAWLWGAKPDGTYGVLTNQQGETSASDADTDIALSLIFAYTRWQDPAYLAAAHSIVQDIWNKEVVFIQGKPYLAADNLEQSSTTYAAINPSYFNPAAYRIFARVDPSHPWSTLADDSYTLLAESIQSPLDTSQSAGLPPDWVQINKYTGALQAIPSSTNTTHFGFDALRVPFRLALDWEWFHDPRDVSIAKSLAFLSAQWDANHQLATTYAHDGTILTTAEVPAMYGGTIGYFMLAAPNTASRVYTLKLAYLYNADANTWKTPLSYYDDNWAWFGIALYNHLLPNLATDLPDSAFKQ